MKVKLTTLILMLALAFQAMAQTSVTVSGTVSDAEGEPLIGASVVAKGTSQGVATDVDGNYEITVKVGSTLLFTYIGYKSTERHIAKGGKVDVVLEDNTTDLDEVVVVGYGVQKKSEVTGAISQVKAEDLQDRTSTSIQSALQGKTSGVQVVAASGAPGSSPNIRVRGYSSNSDMSPLYVVDGVRLSDISGYDPSDIESIEVLKDAASAAIYGAQAGNGVILITTKKGKKDQNGKISYSFQYTNQRISNIPKMLNSEQYVRFMMEAGHILDEQALWNGGWDGVTNTSWIDAAFENSHMFKHNLSLEGANDRGSYYVSLAYTDNNGIVAGDKDTYKRFTGMANGDYKIYPWLKVGNNIQVEKYDVQSVSTNNEWGSMLTAVMALDPLTPYSYAPDNLPAHMQAILDSGKTLLKDENGNYYSVSNYFNAEQFHPMIMRDNSTSKTNGFNVNGVASLDFSAIPYVTITSRLGYRLSASDQYTYSHPYYGSSTANAKYVGYNAQTNKSLYYQWENFANYRQVFAQDHTVTAMAGMSFSKSTSTYTRGELSATDESGNVFEKDDEYLFGDLSFGKTDATKNVGGLHSEATQTSWFGRVGYEYAGKYILQASLRADAYDLSKLPVTNRWGYFPAVSAGWDISREKFMESTRTWLSSLKLRGSWGKNGSIAPLSGYLYATDMTSYGSYSFTGTPSYTVGARPSSMGNKELSWETSTQTNIGIDTRWFNGRLSFNMDWYIKKTDGLLLNGVQPSLIVGGTASPMNAGNVENKGLEFDLGWRDRIGDFFYSVSANLSTLSNKVTYLHPSVSRINGTTFSNNTITMFEVGKPVWFFYGYEYAGIDENGEAIFNDLDGDGEITENDRTNIGCAIPDLTYGITLTAAWKGLDLTVFGSGVSGNDIFMCIQRQDKLMSNRMKEIFYDGRWIAGADNTQATKPGAGASYEKYLFSDAMVFDGSYFRIKQIQLGYTLPLKWTSRIHMSNARIYCSLDDFFTFTKYKGMDPEASAGTGASQGIDKGGYPTSKKIVFGVNVTF